jgi:hypothetical protein
MATYKLIQDIEAEDKILGPLTLRQFIFALITAFFLYICFICVTKGVLFLLALFLPPALFFGFFALPFGRDQPTELWALAKLRFWFKPRRRIWNQSGVKELVTITVPKKIERVLTDGLSKNEVQSRLRALANTIDSRGWAIKNVGASTYAPNSLDMADSDRLVAFENLPQEVPTYQVSASDDIMDPDNNPIARQFDSMITESAQSRRKLLIDQLNAAPAALATPFGSAVGQSSDGPTASNFGRSVAASGSFSQPNPTAAVTAQQADGSADPWFLMPSQPVGQPVGLTAVDKQAEAELSSQVKARANLQHHASYGNMRTLQPLGSQPTAPSVIPSTPPVAATAATTVTAQSDPAILSLSTNNDLNVATLAREAQRNTQQGGQAQDEVVISLH